MSKSNKTLSNGVIASRAGLSTLAIGIIIAIVVILVIGGGAVATFIGHVGPIATVLGYDDKDADKTAEETAAENGTTASGLNPVQEKSVNQTQDKIDTLVASGDPKSIAKADEAAEAQVEAAKESGDDEYIVTAELAKADLLIATARPQEAIDEVLLPLEEKYGNNDTYKHQIDSYLGQAYAAVGNTMKANEYYSRIPVLEGN